MRTRRGIPGDVIYNDNDNDNDNYINNSSTPRFRPDNSNYNNKHKHLADAAFEIVSAGRTVADRVSLRYFQTCPKIVPRLWSVSPF